MSISTQRSIEDPATALSAVRPYAPQSVLYPPAIHPVAIAVGNGFVKVATKGDFNCVRSLIKRSEKTGLSDFTRTKLAVKFESSTLGSDGFTLGDISSKESGALPLSKGQKGEYYAIAALMSAAFLVADGAHIKVICAVPGAAMGERVIGQLKGTHRLTVNGQGKTIHIHSCAVVAEAKGTAAALATNRIESGFEPISFAVIDLGHGNTTLTGMDAEFNTLCHKALEPGVEQLYLDIVSQLEGSEKVPTVDELMNGIKKGSPEKGYKYGPNGRYDFTAAYRECLAAWWAARRAQIETDVAEDLSKADVTLVAGGGASLPELADLAKADGYHCVADPQELEVKGLLELA